MLHDSNVYFLTGKFREELNDFRASQQTQADLLIFSNQLDFIGSYRLNKVVKIRPHQRIISYLLGGLVSQSESE